MKLSEVKLALENVETLHFHLEGGVEIPSHFHVTEVGHITKNFIDCGGPIRKEEVVNFQLWDSTDYDHRLEAEKLRKIIALSEKALGLPDAEIEVEYQSDTIGKYGLSFDGRSFVLVTKKTTCLASDNCGTEKPKVKLSELQTQNTCCNAETSCC